MMQMVIPSMSSVSTSTPKFRMISWEVFASMQWFGPSKMKVMVNTRQNYYLASTMPKLGLGTLRLVSLIDPKLLKTVTVIPRHLFLKRVESQLHWTFLCRKNLWCHGSKVMLFRNW